MSSKSVIKLRQTNEARVVKHCPDLKLLFLLFVCFIGPPESGLIDYRYRATTKAQSNTLNSNNRAEFITSKLLTNNVVKVKCDKQDAIIAFAYF